MFDDLLKMVDDFPPIDIDAIRKKVHAENKELQRLDREIKELEVYRDILRKVKT